MPATIPLKRAALVYAPHETVADVSREINALIAQGLAVVLADGQTLDRGDTLVVGPGAALTSVSLGPSGSFMQSNGTDVTWSPWAFMDNDLVAGDLFYIRVAQQAWRLPIGTSSPAQVLGVSAGLPAWQTASTYLAHALLSATHSDTTAASVSGGELIFGKNSTGKWTALGGVDGGGVLIGAALGSGDPSWLLGSAGHLLMHNGTTWTNVTTLTGAYTMSAAGTALTITNDLRVSGVAGIGGAPVAGRALVVTGDVRITTGLNVGGATVPGTGSAIFTTKVAIGQTAEATNALDVTGKIKTTSHLEIDGDLDHDGSQVGFYGVTPVARPAAYTITNDATDRALDADTVTVADVADVLATVMRDLASQGLLQVS